MKEKTGRRFCKEYKAEVVNLVRQANGNASKVARDIGLSSQAVAGWARQASGDKSDEKIGRLTTLGRAELSIHRKENKDLRMERDFLQETAKWVARESQ